MGSVLPSSESSSRERKVQVPGVGTALQLPSGEIRVQYPDGSHLWVDGKHNIRYRYASGREYTCRDSDNIPLEIMEKMQFMPKVLRHLMPPNYTQKPKSIR